VAPKVDQRAGRAVAAERAPATEVWETGAVVPEAAKEERVVLAAESAALLAEPVAPLAESVGQVGQELPVRAALVKAWAATAAQLDGARPAMDI